MPELIPFRFGSHEVRVQMDGHNEPWWVLQDCCAVLGLTDPHKAATRIDPEDRRKGRILDRRGVTQVNWFINESGLSGLLNRSSKPEAKRIKQWISNDVLPTIRDTNKCKPVYARWEEKKSHETNQSVPTIHSYVYAIRATATHHFKIGYTKDPARRLKALQVGAPFPLEIFGIWIVPSQNIERQIHKKFGAFRTQGEWFDMTEEHIQDFLSYMQSYIKTQPGLAQTTACIACSTQPPSNKPFPAVHQLELWA